MSLRGISRGKSDRKSGCGYSAECHEAQSKRSNWTNKVPVKAEESPQERPTTAKGNILPEMN
jgi:hypothetical protein